MTPIRILQFTDTLGDVNGVSRFIRNLADMAITADTDLTVYCSTRFDIPDQRNIVNFPPRAAMKMPKYENLELVWPPEFTMIAAAKAFRPDVIHISTPGPVGCIGWATAAMLGVPRVGVYHTDFPAYIEELFGDPSMTWMCDAFMKRFYASFRRIFTRSADYRERLAEMGIPRDRLLPLRPGIRIDEFGPRFRDQSVWSRPAGVMVCGGAKDPAACTPTDADAVVRVVYCGRVSVEKNLPVLAKVWSTVGPKLRRELAASGRDVELVIIGDGPYRAEMERVLNAAGAPARFMGFRHGRDLATIYASCDLFVFPSLTDTLGQVVMEAQASGLAVIVGDEGGPREIVRQGETGLVVRGRDERAWSRAIVELVTNHEKRRDMGIAAHTYLTGFSFRASFDHYLEVHAAAARS